jgi:hypothetical protein
MRSWKLEVERWKMENGKWDNKKYEKRKKNC